MSRCDPMAAIRVGLGAALLLLVAGCSSVATAPEKTVSSRAKQTNHQPPTLAVDGDYGFTLTEVVRIDSDVRRDYQQALVLLETDRLDEGIDLLESVVERAPDVTIPYIDLGVAYERKNELDKAEESLQTALSLAPNHPAALNEMGIVYRRTGRFDAARSSYERALAIHPGFHYALLNLGVLCDLYLQDLTCALESYESYARIVTDDDSVGVWIADIRNRLGAGEDQ